MVFPECEPLLPGFEEKAFAQLKKKLLQLADDGGFEIGF